MRVVLGEAALTAQAQGKPRFSAFFVDAWQLRALNRIPASGGAKPPPMHKKAMGFDGLNSVLGYKEIGLCGLWALAAIAHVSCRAMSGVCNAHIASFLPLRFFHGPRRAQQLKQSKNLFAPLAACSAFLR